MAVRKTSSKTAGSENKKQKSVDEMNSDLRIARDAIRELLLTGDTRKAEALYEVGRLVLEVKKDENKYGKEGVKLLSRELRRRKDFFYDCARVAETWSKPAFDALISREGKGGKRLSFSHLVELSEKAEGDLEAVISEVLEKGLPVRATRELIKDGQQGGDEQDQAHHQVLAKLKKRWQKLLKDMGEELGGLDSRGILESEVDLLKDLTELLREASARCMQVVEQHETTRKPVPEKPVVAVPPGNPEQDLHFVEKVSSSTEQPANIRDVPNIGGTDAPQNENPTEEQ